MPAAPVIRAANEDDLAAIQRIYAHHVLHGLASLEESAPGGDEMRMRFRTLAKEGRPYLVAGVDGRVVGYACAGPYRTRSAYRYTVENSVCVEPGLIGRGVGSALLGAGGDKPPDDAPFPNPPRRSAP